MRNLDFSSWNGLLSTLFGLVLVSLVAVGIRLVMMQTIQRRQQRENRQINERLRTLIAAYKTLGGSFTGELGVDPAHLRDIRRGQATAPAAAAQAGALVPGVDLPAAGEAALLEGHDGGGEGSDRRRRIRDAVEAALSDVVLLGTEPQVRLAVQAANEMVAGRVVHTAALVVSLRSFIREALDLEPIPAGLAIPDQGPSRSAGSGGGKGGAGGGGGAGNGGGGQGGGGGGMGGMGAGMGLGRMGHGSSNDPDASGA